MICIPLIKRGITSFNFVRTYNDGSQINLANTPEWLEYFYKNEFYQIGAFERHPSKYESGYALWPHLSGQKIFYDARSYFNIDNGITIIEKQKDSCDFYYFGTTSDNSSIISFYLSNIDLLKRFILYFKEQAHSIISKANQNKIILPNHFENHENPTGSENYIIDSSTINKIRNDFIQETPIKKFWLNGKLEGEYLTEKQIDCVILLIEGKSAKEIAKILDLSFRTVEGHLHKIKEKLNCNNKSELIKKLLDLGLGMYKKNNTLV